MSVIVPPDKLLEAQSSFEVELPQTLQTQSIAVENTKVQNYQFKRPCQGAKGTGGATICGTPSVKPVSEHDYI